MKNNSIVKGVLILTIANIITKFLGFFYRVYMSNVIGSEGMGLFQLIMPLYMLVWSISSSGFSTTISKLVSEENANRKYGNSRLILNQCLITSILISLSLSIILFKYSVYISTEIFKDTRLILSIKIMTICFPFMSAGSCIRGYFFGTRNNIIPAVSQVLEQLCKMIIIYFLSSIFIPLGLEYASAVAVVGMSAGEIFSFFYVWISYKLNTKSLSKKSCIKGSSSYKKILKMSIPLTSNRVLSSFLITVENILIPQKLKAFGYTEKEAMSIFGQFSGMAMPLVMFTSSLLTSLSISIVPVISESIAVKNTNLLKKTVLKAFLFTSIIGIGTAGVFMTFPYELGKVIYNEVNLGDQLFLIGFICPFIYFQVTLSGILNGLGKQFFIFRNSLISYVISISCIYFLTPIYGIKGSIFGYFLSILIVTIFSMKKVHKSINFNINVKSTFILPIICIIASCLTSKLVYKYLLNILGENLAIIVALTFLFVFYLLSLMLLKCIELSDLNLLKNSK